MNLEVRLELHIDFVSVNETKPKLAIGPYQCSFELILKFLTILVSPKREFRNHWKRLHLLSCKDDNDWVLMQVDILLKALHVPYFLLCDQVLLEYFFHRLSKFIGDWSFDVRLFRRDVLWFSKQKMHEYDRLTLNYYRLMFQKQSHWASEAGSCLVAHS